MRTVTSRLGFLRFPCIAGALAFALAGCALFRPPEPYDEILDQGMMEFAEALNVQMATAGMFAGTEDGTYQANEKGYAALDAKLLVLIGRSSAMSAGADCAVPERVAQKVGDLLAPAAATVDAPAGGQGPKSAEACTTKLLRDVQRQLDDIKHLHRDLDRCGPQLDLSCLRPQTAASALSAANRSLNAAIVVERAKK